MRFVRCGGATPFTARDGTEPPAAAIPVRRKYRCRLPKWLTGESTPPCSNRRVVGVRTPRGRTGRGQALAELALILPVIILLMLVAVDFARLFQVQIGVTNAAAQAAILGSTLPNCVTAGSGPGCGNPTNMTYVARTEMNGDALVTVTRSCAGACVSGGALVSNRITVTVTRPFRFLTPMVGNVFPGGELDARATATSVIR